MPNTMIYKVAFIDNDYFTNTYNTAFLNDWDSKSDAEKERFIELASIRIKSLASRPFVDLEDLEQEQAVGVQIATSRLIDYWMEYGLDLNRVSGSVSLGNFSASQTVPSDPDYVPKNVFDSLQDVGLYAPIGFVTDDIYRYDQDRAITYGVRFKTLERVKDVELDKTAAEDANKNLQIPTVGKVLEDIRVAKLSPFAIIGTMTDTTGATQLPTASDLETLFLAGNMVLDDGTILVPVLSNPAVAGERVPVTGEAIRVKLQNDVQEVSDFDGTKWEIDGSKNAALAASNANTAALAELNGLTQARAIKAVEGDLRYVRTDGTNEMDAGYTPTEAKSVVTKEYVDSANSSWAADVATNTNGLAVLKGRVDVIEPIANANKLQLDTNTPAIAANAQAILENAGKIVTSTGTGTANSGRLDAIEQAQALDDKVWNGSIDGADTIDLSSIVDQNGDVFDFTLGKKIELVFEHTASLTEEGRDITVDAPNATTYVIGTVGFTAKLANTGTVSLVKATGGQGSVADFKLIRVVEAKAVKAISTSYSKTESDAKYGTKAEVAAATTAAGTANTTAASAAAVANVNKSDIATLTTNVNTVITDVATKQDSTDAALQTTDKNIVNAINEVKHTADAANAKSIANDQIDTTTLSALEAKLGV